ncbi:RES family NAD+ phosphorylase (plasmid) [Rhodococcus antarcticus]|uniref:RES family NAD+ phosphorylase n=1 Tax=Rhodococcus antarcticus TaxID=2987751 RepID=A0ABY6P725_9NOCA|nr:RES family NAD+ phosphorylase [Rhodococcus antarcticus]UZJ26968.1 RES family NAD+ phosphorylase [Rhodococcus antarcticus]
MDSLADRIAEAPRSTVDGTWERHLAARHVATALEGYTALGRWGTADGFPVLYLGRPRESVVVEAYRHLVDPVEDPMPASAFVPRVCVSATVAINEVLDLRSAAARVTIDIPMDVLQSSTDDRGAYRRCQEVSAVAHQLGLHGLVAPAATGRGHTLVVFPDKLTVGERLVQVDIENWNQLPADPRSRGRRGNLRVVD